MRYGPILSHGLLLFQVSKLCRQGGASYVLPIIIIVHMVLILLVILITKAPMAAVPIVRQAVLEGMKHFWWILLMCCQAIVLICFRALELFSYCANVHWVSCFL